MILNHSYLQHYHFYHSILKEYIWLLFMILLIQASDRTACCCPCCKPGWSVLSQWQTYAGHSAADCAGHCCWSDLSPSAWLQTSSKLQLIGLLLDDSTSLVTTSRNRGCLGLSRDGRKSFQNRHARATSNSRWSRNGWLRSAARRPPQQAAIADQLNLMEIKLHAAKDAFQDQHDWSHDSPWQTVRPIGRDCLRWRATLIDSGLVRETTTRASSSSEVELSRNVPQSVVRKCHEALPIR